MRVSGRTGFPTRRTGNGVGTAWGIARAYSAFAEGGAVLGISSATLASLTAVNVAIFGANAAMILSAP